jgi:hypothetical protein
MSESALNLPKIAVLRRIPEFIPLKPTQIRFISAMLRTNLQVEPAAKLCGIEWRNHYRWKKQEDYAQALEFAKHILGDKLESVMLDHAIEGRETPIVYKGEITGYIREIDAHERITLLKGLRPQYRDNATFNTFIGPSKINIGTPTLASSTTIDITEDQDKTGLDK